MERDIINSLRSWAADPKRKPLILRGARQVGKTTAVSMFSGDFDQYIYLNLDLIEDRNLFEKEYSFDDLLAAIFFIKGKSREKQTLIFIDEIQNSPRAVSLLRYFYEKTPELFVIAAGSLLETLTDPDISFPVGRCEYRVLRPLSFAEFLHGTGEEQASGMLQTVPLPEYAHETMLKLFHRYTLIGGMPEIVAKYAESRDLKILEHLYEGLIVSYLDDVEKYSRTGSQRHTIRHCINNSFKVAGSRIKFEGFGNGPYRSREAGEALRLLEKALLLHLVYPVNGTVPPLMPNTRQSPRLHFFDTGLVNYFSGIMNSLILADDLCALYKGRIAEHIVGQELLATSFSPLHKILFWTREKKQSNAEVDYLFMHHGKTIPVEVKSGKTGTLRSLHQFIERSEHRVAIRLYAGNILLEDAVTPTGKKYRLLNLPYYLASKIAAYADHYFA